MYTITCYTTTKRKKSTMIVDGEGVNFSVTLKNGTSVINPTFYLNVDSFTYNYIKWENRYYWVNNYFWDRNNLCTINCEVDVLASWKNYILNTSAYVNYSESNYNQYIIDPRLMVENRPEITFSSVSMGGGVNSTGCYAVGVIGNGQSSSAGFVQGALVTESNLSQLAKAFNDETITGQLTSQFGDAYGCLVFCKWLPITYPGDNTNVELGGQVTACMGSAIKQRVISNTAYLTIDWPSSDFRRFEPYTEFAVYLPFVGVINLSMTDIANITTLSITWRLDYYTGEIVYAIVNSNGNIGVWAGNAGIDIPMTSYQGNALGALDSVANGLISMAGNSVELGAQTALGNASGAISAANGIFTTALGTAYSAIRNYNTKTASINGGFSGAAGASLGLNITGMLKHYPTSTSPSAMASFQGRPCGKVLKMGNLSGYVQCADFYVSAPCTAYEKNAIENYMKSGVYLE